jgi:hypothetical protein
VVGVITLLSVGLAKLVPLVFVVEGTVEEDIPPGQTVARTVTTRGAVVTVGPAEVELESRLVLVVDEITGSDIVRLSKAQLEFKKLNKTILDATSRHDQ